MVFREKKPAPQFKRKFTTLPVIIIIIIIMFVYWRLSNATNTQ